MLIAKLHEGREKTVLAVCDAELLGKCITEGRRQLDLSSGFYAGVEMSEAEFKAKAKQFDVLNMVGPRVIDIAKTMGLIQAEHIIRVAKIPHAQSIATRKA